MNQKRVSFAVAKAIKEAGYPQGEVKITKIGWYNQAGVYTKELPFLWKGDDAFVALAPTYLDVWLWLWREKKISIELSGRIKNTEANVWNNKDIHNPISLLDLDDRHNYQDPEEAIIAAVEYLVDNQLLK